MKDGFLGVDGKGRAKFQWKVGQSLWMLMVDEATGKPEMEEWIIRTIRGGKVTAIWKLSCTWGKRSTKHGDFGWLPRIPSWTRQTWPVDRKPYNLFTTKLAAIREEIKTQDIRNFDTPEAFNKAIKSLRAMETKNRPKKKAP